MFLVDRKGNSIPYIGSYLSSIYLSIIYRRPLVFAVDNLVIPWPILMKLGMGVDIGMGYSAP